MIAGAVSGPGKRSWMNIAPYRGHHRAAPGLVPAQSLRHRRSRVIAYTTSQGPGGLVASRSGQLFEQFSGETPGYRSVSCRYIRSHHTSSRPPPCLPSSTRESAGRNTFGQLRQTENAALRLHRYRDRRRPTGGCLGCDLGQALSAAMRIRSACQDRAVEDPRRPGRTLKLEDQTGGR